MSLLKRLFRPRPNGYHEIEAIRIARDKSLERLAQSVRRLAHTADGLARQRKEEEYTALLQRFRASEGHD